MTLQVKTEHVRSAARLTCCIGEIRGLAKDNPWKDLRRIVSADGRLVLKTTDGTFSLDWSIPCEGSRAGNLDEVIDSASFDALASRHADGDLYEVESHEGIVLSQTGPSVGRPEGGSRRLQLPGREGPLFPPRALSEGAVASSRWTILASSLARALGFVAPFIGAKTVGESRSVATWTTDGLVVGGTATKAAIVRGLPIAPIPLSFCRRTALVTAAFLERAGGEVEVQAEGAHYAFTCLSSGHRLEVRGEPAPFPVQSLKLGHPSSESYRIDQKQFVNSIAILEVLMATPGASLEFQVKGMGEVASIRISTPGSPLTNSSDEYAIIRYMVPSSNDQGGAPEFPEGRPPVTIFRAKGRLLRETLNRMGGVNLACHFDPRNRLIRIEEEKPEGEVVRSLLLGVQIPEKDDRQGRPSSETAMQPAVDPTYRLPGGLAEEIPLEADPQIE